MEILIILSMFVVVVLYVLFSNPKTSANPTRREGRNSSIYCSDIKNSYPPTQQVFKTIKEANIVPCFSGRQRNEED